MATLLEKIKTHEAKVAVIGIGYVGLPLCVEMAQAGFRTTGYDMHEFKVKQVNAGKSYIGDITDAVLGPLVSSGKLDATTDPKVLADADVVVICVPTPLNKTKEPDNGFIMLAAESLKPHLHKDMLIVLESTTFPGFTREILLPKLQESGLKVGEDFFLCFSPERVDPGNEKYQTKNTPKVVGGTTPRCLEAIQAMYSHVIDTLVPVSSTDAAEMVQAAREHLPRGQHRPRQRSGHHVPQARHEHLGGHRRRGDQALRLHEVLPGPGPRRSLHPGRSAVSVVEAAHAQVRGALHHARRRDQLAHAAPRRREDAGRAQRREEGDQRLEDPHPRHRLQEGHRRPARVAGARRHRALAAEGRRTSAITTPTARR